MIIVLSFDARDGASAKRLATRYNEVIVIKDEVLTVKNHNLTSATPMRQRDELARLTRITIIGHSNSTDKFGKHNLSQFTDFIYKILETNAGILINLTTIDLLGCEVGRIEFLVHESDKSAAFADDPKSGPESEGRFRSFVREFVAQLTPMLARINIQNDLNIYAYSTPEGTLFHKTLLYEDISEDETIPGTWLYLGLSAEQYETFNDLEQQEAGARKFFDKHQKTKVSKEKMVASLRSEIEEEEDTAVIQSKLATIASLEGEILQTDERIQSAKAKVIEKHIATKDYLLHNTTRIIPETDDPRGSLEENAHFCKHVIPGARAEEKDEAATSAELVATQMDLKARLTDAKRLEAMRDTRQLGDIGIVHPVDGDGNCFFSAVADELQRQGLGSDTHKELRSQAVEYLNTHREMFADAPLAGDEEIDTYLVRMAQDKEYAEQHILDAMAKKLKIQLTIIRVLENGERHIMSINQSEDTIGRKIGLIHQGDGLLAHYDALELGDTPTHSKNLGTEY